MDPLLWIAIVMLVSGALGGLVNYFLSDPQDEKQLPAWQHVFVGIVAAFIVPLFLKMASGDLIDKIRGVDGKPSDYSRLFVLAGFCLVAATSSRAFIRSLSERVLQEVRSAKKNAAEAKEQAAEAKAAVAPLVEDEVPEEEGSPASGAGTRETDDVRPVELTPEERAVIKAMTTNSYSMRSVTGIARDSGLSKQAVNTAVSSLIAKHYIVQSQSGSGQPRWYLSSIGRTIAAGG